MIRTVTHVPSWLSNAQGYFLKLDQKRPSRMEWEGLFVDVRQMEKSHLVSVFLHLELTLQAN